MKITTSNAEAQTHNSISGVRRIRQGWLQAPWLAVLALVTASCTADLQADIDCAVDAECDDNNPCTVDVCTAEGWCEVRAAEPEEALLDQVAGDCLVFVCRDGLVEAVPADDPFDDLNPCTEDRCSNGSPTNPRTAQDPSCVE